MQKAVITLLVLTVIVLGAGVYRATEEIEALRGELVHLEKTIQNVEFRGTADNNALQDSLEERIGTLERAVDGLQFVFGSGKKGKK